VVSEMLIVDTFTKLIFGEGSRYTDGELAIIQALRQVDANVALDSHLDMGVYLRALGVREMIILVGQVRSFMADDMALPIPSAGLATGHPQRLY
jgi:hypothetical protein